MAHYLEGSRLDYPPFPKNYLSPQCCAILEEYKTRLKNNSATIKDFPEQLIMQTLDNTWHDSASAIINNWIGCFYQVTNEDIKLPFMESVNPQNPLGL
jgi:homoserine O-succinyltransferase